MKFEHGVIAMCAIGLLVTCGVILWQDNTITELNKALAVEEQSHYATASQYTACQSQLDKQSDKILQSAIDKDKAAAALKEANHRADQNYFDRRKATENMEQLEAVEYMLNGFLEVGQ